jgi:DNA-binding HxlR family transcriptional regulator
VVGEEEYSGDEDIDRIFLVASHRIRRKIIESIAEKGPRSFTELMDDAGVSDTGTMTFHLRRMAGFIRKNEKGVYELTELGWRAYNIIKGAGKQSIKRDEEKRSSERIVETPSMAKPAEPRNQVTPGTPVVISDMFSLTVNRDMLERIRAQGRRLIITDVFEVKVGDDVEPELFDEVVESIRDVFTLRVPDKILPIAQLKSRDVFWITSKDRKEGGGHAAILSPFLGSLGAFISSIVSSAVSNVMKSLAPILRSIEDKDLGQRGALLLKESFPNAKGISIDMSGGIARISPSDRGDVVVTIYERGGWRSKCEYDLDLDDGELSIDLSGCEAIIETPKTGLEALDLDASGGYIDISLSGVKRIAGHFTGSVANISSTDMGASSVELEISGGKVTLDLSYSEFGEESSIDLDVSGGILDLRARVPKTIRVESRVSRTGGFARIDIDEALARVESPRGTLRIGADVMGGLVNVSVKPREG